jgi:diguanylate cyclase (GGDEF)-like protein
LFRVGGEEFVIILEPVTFETASRLIEGFRQTIANHEFSQIGTVTVSVGYTKITEKDFPPTVLESADKALYFAKESGRNCVYNYEELLAENKVTPPRKGGSVDLF